MLGRIFKRLQRASASDDVPVIAGHHDVFGQFVFEDVLESAAAKFQFEDKPVEISVDLSNGKKYLDYSSILDDLAEGLDSLLQDATSHICKTMLETAQDWTEDPNLSESAFRARISLSDITVGTDRSLEIMFDDGGVFFGHWIELNGNIDGEFLQPGLFG